MHNKLNYSKPLNYIFSLVLGTLIVVWVVISTSQWSDITNSYHKINNGHAENTAVIIKDIMTTVEISLNEVADGLVDFAFSDAGHAEIKNRLMTQLKMMPGILAITEADGDGHLLRIPSLSKELSEMAQFSPKSRPWYQNATANYTGAFFTGPYEDYVLKRRVISVSRTVVKNNGSTSGVVALDIELESLAKKLEQLVSPVSGNTFIITTDGESITQGASSKNKSNHSELLSYLYDNNGYFYHPDSHSYYYYNTLTAPQWIVFFKVDKGTLSELAFNESIKVTYGLVFALMVILFSWWGMKSVIDSIYMSITTSLRHGSFDNNNNASTLLLHELKHTTDHIENITEATLTDSLTTLHNRRAFDLALLNVDNCYVAMIDIDNFKKINDVYGHTVGDQVLKAVASFFIEEETENVKCYRYGGEEFTVLFQNIPFEHARSVLENVRKKVEKRKFREECLHVTFSAGLCSMRNTSANEAIEKADNLLYKAKSSGKNLVAWEAPVSADVRLSDNPMSE